MIGEWIADRHRRRDPQQPGSGRGDEAGRACEQGRRGLASRVDRADDHERQQREELAVLLGHVLADDLRADTTQAFGAAGGAL